MTDAAIQIKNLRKTYSGSKKSAPKTALHGIDIDIPRGSMFALLGPNGAGKSTLINILAGLVVKSEGEASIWGYDITTQTRNAKRSIGIVPQEITFDPFFTPRQILNIQAGLYGVRNTKQRTDELLELVGLQDKADAWARSLSGGMKRRLMVAKALVHNPPILILDEPTAGVDVELRRQLWANVKELNRQGVTVLLTTHYLEEAESLCDHIAIINHGRIITNERKDDLMRRIGSKEIRFFFDQDLPDVPKALSEKWPVRQHAPNVLAISIPSGELETGAILDDVRALGMGITDVTTVQSHLEDIFIQLTSDKEDAQKAA